MKTIKITSQEEFDKLPKRFKEYTEIQLYIPVSKTVKVKFNRINSTVRAYANSTVRACDNSTVEARDNSTVIANDNSTVVAYDNSTVVAYDNSTVVAYGNSAVKDNRKINKPNDFISEMNENKQFIEWFENTPYDKEVTISTRELAYICWCSGYLQAYKNVNKMLENGKKELTNR